MNHRFIGSLMVCVAAIGGCANARTDAGAADTADDTADRPAAQAATGALGAAHEAYLDGNFVALGERVRDVLLDPASTDGVKENAYELLDKAYEAQGGKLPSGFTPPPGYGRFTYAVFRVSIGRATTYDVRFRGLARDASHVAGLTLRHLPDGMVLDKADPRSHFQIRHDPGVQKAGLQEFALDSGPIPAPPEDGVVTVRLELDDGTVSEGFFIARSLASSVTPEVTAPAPWATLRDPSPVVAWSPFHSPERAPFEQRAMGVQLRRDGEPNLVWEQWSDKPDDFTEARLGSPAGVGRSALAPGSYRVSVTASEHRFFGPVELSRGSRTTVPVRLTQ
jgi:hypothetical protein